MCKCLRKLSVLSPEKLENMNITAPALRKSSPPRERSWEKLPGGLRGVRGGRPIRRGRSSASNLPRVHLSPPGYCESWPAVSQRAMARSQLAQDDGTEVIDAAELLNADVYADLEPNALPDTPEAREHGLFLERLEQLMHEQDEAVRAFAEREGKPVDYVRRRGLLLRVVAAKRTLPQIRRHVALAHSRFLFDKSLSENVNTHPGQGVYYQHSCRSSF